jgi:tyrosine-specific transport protein
MTCHPLRLSHALFLVLGTAMGGGILALPLAVATNGFLPAAGALTLCFLFMGVTADLTLQANLWCPPGTHLDGTARRLLGPWGARLVWILFGFVGYASLVAYLAGAAGILQAILPESLGLTQQTLEVVLTIVFGAILATGAHHLARFNSLFVVLMLLALAALLGAGYSQAILHPLAGGSAEGLLQALPLFLTSFSFQMIVPSLRRFLQEDAQAVRIACWGGLSVTLLLYLAWLGMVFSLVPREGLHSLASAAAAGQPITVVLLPHLGSPWLSGLVTFFSLFAITTSFLGIGLGLYEFLLDGLHRVHVRLTATARKLFLLTISLGPVLAGALAFERVFLEALDLTGGLGDSTLNGLIPVAMVLQGWSRAYQPRILELPIARLVGCSLFALLVIGIELHRLSS